MDEKEIHKILRYKRPSDSWVCPECDTENSITLKKCFVCGNIKSIEAKILKAWTEADDRPVTPPPNKRTTTTTSGPIFKDEYFDAPDDEENKNVIIWTAVVIMIFLCIVFAIIQNGY